MGARDEEIRGRQIEQQARGMFFDCEFCVRTDDPRYTGPTLEDDGETMAPSEILEHYNQRRYEHLQRDFQSTKDLREHLTDRAHWWAKGKGKDALDVALQAVDSTVEMLGRRLEAKHAEERRERRERKAMAAPVNA